MVPPTRYGICVPLISASEPRRGASIERAVGGPADAADTTLGGDRSLATGAERVASTLSWLVGSARPAGSANRSQVGRAVGADGGGMRRCRPRRRRWSGTDPRDGRRRPIRQQRSTPLPRRSTACIHRVREASRLGCQVPELRVSPVLCMATRSASRRTRDSFTCFSGGLDGSAMAACAGTCERPVERTGCRRPVSRSVWRRPPGSESVRRSSRCRTSRCRARTRGRVGSPA